MRTCEMPGCVVKHFAKGFCKKHYNAAWDKANATKKIAYRVANNEWNKLRCARWYANNKVKANAASREMYLRDLEKSKANRRAWYAANRKSVKQKTASWAAANKEASNAAKMKHKARKRSAEGAHTGEEVKELLVKQKGRCAVCQLPLQKNYHKDHIQALVNGGNNWIENIQLLCPSCNCSKRSRDPIEFMQSRGFLL